MRYLVVTAEGVEGSEAQCVKITRVREEVAM